MSEIRTYKSKSNNFTCSCFQPHKPTMLTKANANNKNIWKNQHDVTLVNKTRLKNMKTSINDILLAANNYNMGTIKAQNMHKKQYFVTTKNKT